MEKISQLCNMLSHMMGLFAQEPMGVRLAVGFKLLSKISDKMKNNQFEKDLK